MYSPILKKTMNLTEIKDLCVSITLNEGITYPLCFIEEENYKFLIVASTGEDACERIVIIDKKNIMSVSVVYQQDIADIFEGTEEERMFR